MAGRQTSTRKCSECKRVFPREEVVIKGGKNFCPTCLVKKEQDAQNYKDLCAYIQELADFDNTVFPVVTSQIKNYKQEFGFTNASILYTLRYMHELKEPPVEFKPESGIALVPYYHREAQIFRYHQEKLEDTELQTIQDSLNCEAIQITLNRSDIIKKQEEFERKKKEKQSRLLIDLDDIDLEDDETIFEDEDILNYNNRIKYRQKHKYDIHTYDWGEE